MTARRRVPRRAGRAALLVVLAVLATSCRRPADGGPDDAATAPPAGAATASAVTQVVTYQAFDDSGLLPGLVRAGAVSGACAGGSVALAGRADAWRCAGGDRVLDPCFSMEAGGELACVADPFTREVTMLQISGALPRGNRNDPGRLPWFLELEDGTRCGAAGGEAATTAAMIGGRQRTYTCASGAEVYGDPDGSHSMWTAQVRGASGSPGLTVMAVRTAWY